MLIYIICIALGFAIGAMLAWHLWLIGRGQTTVESHDASHYKKVAKNRGGAAVSSLHIHNEIDLLAEVFVNCYDLGARENLKLFFNVTSNGQYVF